MPTASAPYARPAPGAPPPPPRADAAFGSGSGVGGGNLGCDEWTLPRLFLRLGGLQLQLAGGGGGRAALEGARDAFAGAARCGRDGAPAWAAAWLGLARVQWAAGGAGVDAEASLGEANALDNGNAQVWGWLAYVCLCGGAGKREREAAAALQQALKEVRLLRGRPRSATPPPQP